MQGIATFRAFGWVPNGIARSDQLLDDSTAVVRDTANAAVS